MDPNQTPANPPYQPPPPNVAPAGQPANPAPPPPPTQPQPTYHIEPEEEHPNNMFKAIIGLVVIFILIGTVVVIYYSKTNTSTTESQAPEPTIVRKPSPTPTNPTANWNTYTDNVYTIQYPPTSTFEKTPGAIAISSVKFTDASKSAVLITVTNNTKNLTLTNAFPSGKNIQNITIDGAPAVMVENTQSGSSTTTFDIIAIRNNKVFEFQSQTMPYKDFQLMLSTFKFTEPTISIPAGQG